jgi:hypothetical protein
MGSNVIELSSFIVFEFSLKVGMHWMKKLWSEYGEKPKFFFYLDTLTSVDEEADKKFFEFLGWFSKPVILDDTVLVVVSDYGQIDKSIGLTVQVCCSYSQLLSPIIQC